MRFADGKLEGTNVVGAAKKSTVTMVTGCKNTDDVILVEQGWLPDGYSQIFRIICVWPFGLLDYGSAMLRCII